MSAHGEYVAPDRAFRFTLTPGQHEKLKAGAAEAGLTIQAYLELTVFGEIRPRGPHGPRPYTRKQEEQLPMTG